MIALAPSDLLDFFFLMVTFISAYFGLKHNMYICSGLKFKLFKVFNTWIVEEKTPVDIIVKLNMNINVKIKYRSKTRVIPNMCCGAFVNGCV